MVTAHGGAMGTGRITEAFFDNIDNYKADAFEVDIWKRGKLLYLSHFPSYISYKKKLTLRYAFEVAKEKGLKINCDLKQKGIIKKIIQRINKTQSWFFETINKIDESLAKVT